MNKVDISSQNFAKKKSNPFWKFFWLAFLVISLAYAWYSFYAPSNKVNWVDNITPMEELTNNSSNKNTLLFFTGKWCSPCLLSQSSATPGSSSSYEGLFGNQAGDHAGV